MRGTSLGQGMNSTGAIGPFAGARSRSVRSAGEVRERPRAAFAGSLLILASLAAGLTLCATRDGIGLSTDSDAYLTAARTLAHGQGISEEGPEGYKPLTHFPPLYPMIIAGISALGIAPGTAARAMNVATAMGSVLMAGWILRRGIGVSHRAALVGAATLAVSVHLVSVNSMVWTEGLFILLTLVTLALLGRFLDERRRAVLIAAALATGLAMMTRYAGAAVLIAGLVLLLGCGVRARRRRLIDAMIFTCIAAAPMVAWAVRNTLLAGSVANRRIGWHPPDEGSLAVGANAVAQWVWPTESRDIFWPALAAAVGVIALAALSARNARAEGRQSRAHGGEAGGAAAALAWFAAIYAAFIVTSITLFDAATPLDRRILSPLFAATALAVVAELSRSRLPAHAGTWARRWPVVLKVAASVYLGIQLVLVSRWVAQAPQGHLGFGTRAWRQSELIAYARSIPATQPIYSNGRAPIHLHTGRITRPVPTTMDPATRQEQTNLAQRLNVIERDLKAGGYLLFFTTIRHPAILQDEDLERLLRLRRVQTFADGHVYQWRTDDDAKKLAAAARVRAKAKAAREAKEARQRKAARLARIRRGQR